MPASATLARLGNKTARTLGRIWWEIWFQKTPTLPIEITRAGVGGALLVHYALAIPFLFEFWTDAGWMPRSLALRINDAWTPSIFFYLTEPWHLVAFHALFLFCCAALMVGWQTRWVKWVVFAGQISYHYRNPILPYGVDQIAACLLFVMCLAPIGRALSLDRVRAVRQAKKRNGLDATVPRFASEWTGACTRLIQIQMAALFFYTGVSKIKWEEWRNGDAIWQVFSTYDYYNTFLVDLMARHYWISNFATYGTIFIEVAFPFLIWQRATRPYMLAAAIFLHVMFGTTLALTYFSFVMVMGHVSFIRPEWLARLGEFWKRKMGKMEMIYDGKCGFCVRSMAWLLAFDGLGQIKIRNFRTRPSPVVSNAKLEKALYLILPDGRALPGFEAYRYVVLRVPGLWWLIPFFYVPVLSRLFGHPIYNWVAANRSRLSRLRLRRSAAKS